MSADDVVRLWREANSLERDADFAFFWDHKHEAIAEAGQLIADAWEFCRRRVSQGLGSVVKDLLALEEAPLLLAPAEPKSVPSAAVPTQLVKKTTKPSQAARFRPTFEAVEAPKEPFVELLLEIAREASSLAVGVGETRSDLVDAMRPKMLQLVQATELPTLRRVKDTWRDIANWCDESGLNTGKLSPSQLSRFYQESTSPSRVLPALKWLAKNLTINWELSLCVGRSTQAKGRHGVGARQAPTAEPLMFATLQDSLEAALSHGTDVLPALVTMWLVVMGCVRLGHVQRSEWVRITTHSLYFVCRRGKQKGQRQGFQWSCPRFTAHTQVDLGKWFIYEWTQNPAGPPPAIGFDPATRRQLSAKAIVDASRLGVAAVVPPDEFKLLTSKSWRQMPVTWGLLCELTPAQMVALGNWTDQQQDRTVSAMPLRYTGSKQHLALVLKHTFAAFLALVWDSRDKLDMWNALTREFCISARDHAFNAACKYLAEQEDVIQREGPAGSALLVQKHFTLRVRGLKRPLYQLEPLVAAGKKSRSTQESPGGVERDLSLPVEPVVADDEYFDNLAKQRWSRVGHASKPEPPTVVYRHGNGAVVLLGGIPDRAACATLAQHDVKLVISCFNELCTERGGIIPKGSYQMKFNLTAQRNRQPHWEAIKLMINPTLAHGHSILVHCAAGVHRAPIGCAMILAVLKGEPFANMVEHIQRVRNIEPWKIIGDRSDADFKAWVHAKASGDTFPLTEIRVPARWIAAATPETALWHLVPARMPEENPHPVCKWRQKEPSFRKGIVFADSVHEALTHERPFCRACYNFMPAHVLGELAQNRVYWKNG